MSDWVPQVVKILKVEMHPDADALDVVTVVSDYPVIVKRNEYKVGDLAAYIPIDTIVPDTEQFHFVCPPKVERFEEDGQLKTRSLGPRLPVGSVPEKNRIVKARKIRGVYSQGLLVPCPPGLRDGNRLDEILALKKWQEEEEENVPGFRPGRKEEGPSAFKIPHYDVVPVRRLAERLEPGEEVVLTEKIHGSNAAFMHDGERLWAKSRNFFKERHPDDMWWDIALRLNLEEKLRDAPMLVFFGEIYGHVKGFRYDAGESRGKEAGSTLPAAMTRVRFFDVLDAAAGRYLPFDERVRALEARGLEAVPVLYRGPWLGRDSMYAHAEGPTTLGGGKHVREGWVLCTTRDPGAGRLHVKLVGQGYNLQK